jgi:hypothetical protein
MYCPECGFDAGDAKFCPECGHGLERLRSSLDGGAGGKARSRPARTTGSRAGSRGGSKRRQDRPPRPAPAASRPSGPRAAGKTVPAKWLWLGVVGIAAVVVVVVVASQLRSPTSGANASTPVAADTSGSYDVLVTRANGLYDQGAQAQQDKNTTAAANFFQAAATVYAAAWKKQPGDPGVGTDYATSLFYSGDTPAALRQVNRVLAKNPTFQNALLNKGVFLQNELETAQQNGQTAKVSDLRAKAQAVLKQAVKVNPSSNSGKAAARLLSSF